MKGLIAAALGGASKGVGQVAATQMEVNARKALMEAEEEMRARLAEAAEGRAETRQIAAEERAITNIPRMAEATAAAEEGIMARRFGEGSAYSGLLQQQMEAQQTPGQREQVETFRSDREWENKVRGLRESLADAESDEDRQKITDRLSALTAPFGGSEKTMSDMIAAGNGYINAANRAFQEADRIDRETRESFDYSDEEKQNRAKNSAALRAQAAYYLSESDRFFQASGRRRFGEDLSGGSAQERPSLSDLFNQ